MNSGQTTKELYFISDLHLSGKKDEIFEAKDELIGFLRLLRGKTETELIIIGDAFNLWEMPEQNITSKMKAIEVQNQEIFSELKKIGATVGVSVISGNHDYELEHFDEIADFLKDYNIGVIKGEHIEKRLGGSLIWIEHGNQADDVSRIETKGKFIHLPIGFFLNQKFIANASELAQRGKHSWYEDIKSIEPSENIFNWIFSNYFYKEMTPILRFALLPFLLLFTISMIVFVGSYLERYNLIPSDFFTGKPWLYLGIFGDLLNIIFAVNIAVITFLLMLSLPISFIFRDIKKSLKRYSINTGTALANRKEKIYEKYAEKIFNDNPERRIFIYGHTHNAYLKTMKGRAIINTGTWLKRLNRVKSRFLLLPSVYSPDFNLGYFKLSAVNGKIKIEYEKIEKKAKADLTWLERMVIWKKSPKKNAEIPKETII
jgi:UDP-2,3-diacylglucosamine pyrophosphatase LpxH